MDYLTELGGLALGSRLKLLSERLSQEVASIYSQEHIQFEPRWFPLFHLLATRSAVSITDIARAICVTHPAVNQIAQEMLAAGVIVAIADAGDKRKRILSLSNKGQKLFSELGHAWRVIRLSVSDAIEESGHDLLQAIEAFENALDKRDLPSRFLDSDATLKKETIEIIDFQPAYKDQFRKLNEAWIRRYFVIEPADKEILSRPEKIVTDGGAVFFARLGERVAGNWHLAVKAPQMVSSLIDSSHVVEATLNNNI